MLPESYENQHNRCVPKEGAILRVFHRFPSSIRKYSLHTDRSADYVLRIRSFHCRTQHPSVLLQKNLF